jgi:hypothetical protein
MMARRDNIVTEKVDGKIIVTVICCDNESHGVEFAADADGQTVNAAFSLLIEKLAGVSKSDLLIALTEAA